MCGFVLSFCDTVYVPSLIDIEKEFGASEDVVVATLSIYLFSVGVFGLFWGPFGDKYALYLLFYLFFLLSFSKIRNEI